MDIIMVLIIKLSPSYLIMTIPYGMLTWNEVHIDFYMTMDMKKFYEQMGLKQVLIDGEWFGIFILSLSNDETYNWTIYFYKAYDGYSEWIIYWLFSLIYHSIYYQHMIMV